ncbi:hypothetical protein OESDEN_12093 [Oesophagostomum dentatum]|uniref:Uncharacterized protein n=1 Tax=Oesophagostomum dentatum TaxID=61180 RepID=A0A0B1SW52_OESDE|nr:hypothetical protein OESDEN_12093 [Oesophagostomum dentatum]
MWWTLPAIETPRYLTDRTDNEEEDDISLELEETTTIRPRRYTTPVPLPRQNMLYTVLPSLQKEKDWRKYCPVNQYTFQLTCLPGKKLRYDLQIFCQEFSEKCGVPNLNLYPSRHPNPDDGRPVGYGQKQKNGQLGLGRSFGFGLGAIPGLEVVSSQGADIGSGSLPFLNQIGGIMLNYGTEMGALGQRIGKGPARSLNALTHGYPSLGLAGEPNNGDKKLSQELLKSFGIPNIPGLNKLFSKLGGNKPNKRTRGYEPGYGAVNPHAPIAIGKVSSSFQLILQAYYSQWEILTNFYQEMQEIRSTIHWSALKRPCKKVKTRLDTFPAPFHKICKDKSVLR